MLILYLDIIDNYPEMILLVTADIPDGIFVTYLSSPNGSFEARTEDALDRTQGSCVSYLQLDSGGNHYAINDWNHRSAPHQVSLPAIYLHIRHIFTYMCIHHVHICIYSMRMASTALACNVFCALRMLKLVSWFHMCLMADEKLPIVSQFEAVMILVYSQRCTQKPRMHAKLDSWK